MAKRKPSADSAKESLASKKVVIGGAGVESGWDTSQAVWHPVLYPSLKQMLGSCKIVWSKAAAGPVKVARYHEADKRRYREDPEIVRVCASNKLPVLAEFYRRICDIVRREYGIVSKKLHEKKLKRRQYPRLSHEQKAYSNHALKQVWVSLFKKFPINGVVLTNAQADDSAGKMCSFNGIAETDQNLARPVLQKLQARWLSIGRLRNPFAHQLRSVLGSEDGLIDTIITYSSYAFPKHQ